MAGLNRVELMGNLTKDAVLRYTQTNQPVVSMRIACNESYFQNGQRQERVTYIPVTLWGKRGEALVNAECLQKGQALYLECRWHNGEYVDQEGVKRYTVEAVVKNHDGALQLLARRGSQVPAQPQETPTDNGDDSPPNPDDFAD